jgi:hypothetical protein
MCDEDPIAAVGAAVAVGGSLSLATSLASISIGVVAVVGVIASAVTALVGTFHTAVFVAETFGLVLFLAYAMKTAARHFVRKASAKPMRSVEVERQPELGAGHTSPPQLEAGEPVIDLTAVREAKAA